MSDPMATWELISASPVELGLEYMTQVVVLGRHPMLVLPIEGGFEGCALGARAGSHEVGVVLHGTDCDLSRSVAAHLERGLEVTLLAPCSGTLSSNPDDIIEFPL